MKRYKLTEHGVIDTKNGMSIPDAPGNRHWKEYQEWLAEGNEPISLQLSKHHVLINDVWVLDEEGKEDAEWLEEMERLDKAVTARTIEDVLDVATGTISEVPARTKKLMEDRKKHRIKKPKRN